MSWHSVEGISDHLPMHQNGLPYFLVCTILSTDNTTADGNSGTVRMSHTFETQGLLIMTYIQNVNFIASFIQQYNFSSHANFVYIFFSKK